MGPQRPTLTAPAAATIRWRVVAAFVATAFALVAAPAPALAHNSLTGSDPPDGARVAAAPETVRLSFLSRLDPATTTVTVTGPDGVTAAAGKPAFAGKRVTVPLRAGPAGRYTIAYEVESGDGHPIRGKVTFTLTTGARPATPSAAITTAPPAKPSPTAIAAPSAERVADEENTPWWRWALGGVALLVLVAGGAFLVGRRRT